MLKKCQLHEIYKSAFGCKQKVLSSKRIMAKIDRSKLPWNWQIYPLGNINFKRGFTQIDLNNQLFSIQLACITAEVDKVMAIENVTEQLVETLYKSWGQKRSIKEILISLSLRNVLLYRDDTI